MSLVQNGQPCFSILCSHLVDFCQSGPPGVSTDRVETLAAVDVGPLSIATSRWPLIFAESGSPDTPYVADLYENISFLGDLNRQISSLPDGAKVRIRVKR